MDENYNLNTKWTLWFHSINEKDWSINSYQKILEINNLFDLNILINTVESNHLQNGMFFVMKDDILPIWEYPDNREGYSLSYKIPGSFLKDNWNLILLKMFNEDIFNNEDKSNLVNGLSISPKKEFNIIKIWFAKDVDRNDIFEKRPYFIKEKSIYKKNIS